MHTYTKADYKYYNNIINIHMSKTDKICTLFYIKEVYKRRCFSFQCQSEIKYLTKVEDRRLSSIQEQR